MNNTHVKASLKHSSAKRDAPNYLSVGMGYFEHAIAPFTEKWMEWSKVKRILAVVHLLPLAFFPLMFTFAIVLPAVLFAAAVMYILMFGWETSRRHAQETFNERFGQKVKKAGASLEDLRARALQLKVLAGNYGADGLYYAVDGASVAGHYVLAVLMFVLDYVIEMLVSLSRSLNVHKKKLEERASHRTTPVKKSHNTAAKPLRVADDN